MRTKEAQDEASESAVAKEKPSGKGTHEGITVHGHWTIEVRNQDGSLARHVEFENSLDPDFTTPNTVPGQPPATFPGGAAYLSAVLSGVWSAPVPVTPTELRIPPFWTIWLVGPAGLSNIPNTTNAPCAVTSGTASGGVCEISGIQTGYCTTGPGQSCNLSVQPLGTAPNFTGIQLTGSVAANQKGQVSTVASFVGGFLCLNQAIPNRLPNVTNRNPNSLRAGA